MSEGIVEGSGRRDSVIIDDSNRGIAKSVEEMLAKTGPLIAKNRDVRRELSALSHAAGRRLHVALEADKAESHDSQAMLFLHDHRTLENSEIARSLVDILVLGDQVAADVERVNGLVSLASAGGRSTEYIEEAERDLTALGVLSAGIDATAFELSDSDPLLDTLKELAAEIRLKVQAVMIDEDKFLEDLALLNRGASVEPDCWDLCGQIDEMPKVSRDFLLELLQTKLRVAENELSLGYGHTFAARIDHLLELHMGLKGLWDSYENVADRPDIVVEGLVSVVEITRALSEKDGDDLAKSIAKFRAATGNPADDAMKYAGEVAQKLDLLRAQLMTYRAEHVPSQTLAWKRKNPAYDAWRRKGLELACGTGVAFREYAGNPPSIDGALHRSFLDRMQINPEIFLPDGGGVDTQRENKVPAEKILDALKNLTALWTRFSEMCAVLSLDIAHHGLWQTKAAILRYNKLIQKLEGGS